MIPLDSEWDREPNLIGLSTDQVEGSLRPDPNEIGCECLSGECDWSACPRYPNQAAPSWPDNARTADVAYPRSPFNWLEWILNLVNFPSW